MHDKDLFKKRVLNKCGLFNSGNPSKEHNDFIGNFFGVGEYENTIVLLDIPTNPEIPLEMHINVFDVLSGYLMAYINIITESLGASHNNLIHPIADATAG